MINRGLGEAYMGLNNFKTALDYFKIYLGIFEIKLISIKYDYLNFQNCLLNKKMI